MRPKDFDGLWRKIEELKHEVKSPADEVIQDILEMLIRGLFYAQEVK